VPAFSLRFIRLVPAFLTVGLGAAIAATPQMVLDYRYRYNCQTGEPGHLLDAVAIDGGRALVAGNRGIAVVDLSLLTREGSRSYIHRLTGLNARNLYVRGRYVYVNPNRGETQGSPGFAVVRIDPDRLVHLRTIEEAGVLYEKMHADGDHLFVAAHNKGIQHQGRAQPLVPGPPGIGGGTDRGDLGKREIGGNQHFRRLGRHPAALRPGRAAVRIRVLRQHAFCNKCRPT